MRESYNESLVSDFSVISRSFLVSETRQKSPRHYTDELAHSSEEINEYLTLVQ